MRFMFIAAAGTLVVVSLAHAQQVKPIHGSALSATPAIAELLDPFRDQLDSAEVAEVLDRRKRWTGFPRNAEEHVLAARLWRRAGRPGLALKELERLRPAEQGPLGNLERARVLLESDVDRVAGAAAWWAACEQIDEATRAEVEWDLRALMTPAEREQWDDLEAGRSTCEWLHGFWDERAHRMAITTDERLALHYRRLAHAREWYWIPRPYFLKWPADYHGRPEGLAIDDRGLIYVRMGAPLTDEGFSDDRAGEPGAIPSIESGVDGDQRIGEGESRRCWVYWRFGGYRIYCFAGERGDRLDDKVVASPGTQFFHKYVVNSNLPKTFIRNRVVHGFRGLEEDWERSLSAAEQRGGARHAQVRTRENIDEALKQIPDVPAVLANVRLRVETLRFLNPSHRRWQIWTLASVRAGDLRVTLAPDGRRIVNVGGRYSVLESEGVRIDSFAPAEVPVETIEDDAGITLKSVFTAEPGRQPITVVVEDLNEPPAGNYHRDTVNVPAIGGLPQLSDIAVAQAVGGTWTRDGRTFLQVTPAHITNPDGSIHTYFEVYGVRPGTRYEVEFRLTETDAAERIWRLEPDDLAFRLQFTSEMEGEIGRHHLELDLSETEPGEYALAVRIQDEDSGAYSLPAVTDVFVAE